MPPCSVILIGNQFIPAEQAFRFDFRQQGSQLRLSWDIHLGYYLYRQQIQLEPVNATFGAFTLPAGSRHHDEFYGDVAIYRDELLITVPLTQAQNDSQLRVSWQGCAEAGFCYPPETQVIPLSAIAAAPPGGTGPGSVRPHPGTLTRRRPKPYHPGASAPKQLKCRSPRCGRCLLVSASPLRPACCRCIH